MKIFPSRIRTQEHLTEIGVVEGTLRSSVITENDLTCMSLCAVVDTQTAQLSENLPSYEVLLTSFERSLGRENIVTAVVGNTLPMLLINRLVLR